MKCTITRFIFKPFLREMFSEKCGRGVGWSVSVFTSFVGNINRKLPRARALFFFFFKFDVSQWMSISVVGTPRVGCESEQVTETSTRLCRSREVVGRTNQLRVSGSVNKAPNAVLPTSSGLDLAWPLGSMQFAIPAFSHDLFWHFLLQVKRALLWFTRVVLISLTPPITLKITSLLPTDQLPCLLLSRPCSWVLLLHPGYSIFMPFSPFLVRFISLILPVFLIPSQNKKNQVLPNWKRGNGIAVGRLVGPPIYVVHEAKEMAWFIHFYRAKKRIRNT